MVSLGSMCRVVTIHAFLPPSCFGITARVRFDWLSPHHHVERESVASPPAVMEAEMQGLAERCALHAYQVKSAGIRNKVHCALTQTAPLLYGNPFSVTVHQATGHLKEAPIADGSALGWC